MDMMLRCLWLWIQLERQPLLLADHAARQTLDDNAIDAASVATENHAWWRCPIYRPAGRHGLYVCEDSWETGV